jgi:hypothetical protein
MRILVIVSSLGMALSGGATTYATSQYFALSRVAEGIKVSAPGPDVVTPKLDALLADHKSKNLVLDELKSRREYSAVLQATLSKEVASSKTHAFYEMLLWIAAFILFAVLRVKLKTLRT